VSPGSRLGGWSIIGDRVGVEAMCRSGVDFIGIDAQHGFFAFDQAAVAVQVANLCRVHCLVRVPAGQLSWAPRYLDAGADGIVVAMVNSLEEAEQAVELTRYQPVGQRSYGGGPRNGVGQRQQPSPGSDLPEVFLMVETRKALEQLEGLSRVPGITGLYIGPVDLGLAMDRPYPLSSDDGPWLGAVGSLVDACDKQGIRAGMFATGGEDARNWLAAGFSDVVLSSDIAMLRRSLHEHLDQARQPVDPTSPLRAPSYADPYAGR
jgi:4-hydroxy-2-oxoheptanedioate aldolase